MKEFNLTRQAQNTYSGGMPEPGRVDAKETVVPSRPVQAAESQKASSEQSLEQVLKAQGINTANLDTRQTIRLMKESGVTPQDVIRNASLDDSSRLTKAEQVLERSLTDQEKKGLLSAHGVGKGEEGKDEAEAGVFNYKTGQLLRKAEILKESGFDKQERRILMEEGLAGDPIDMIQFTDPVLQSIADAYNDALARSIAAGNPDAKLDERTYSAFMARINNLIDNPASLPVTRTEGRELLRQIYTNFDIDRNTVGPEISRYDPRVNEIYEDVMSKTGVARKDAIIAALVEYSPHTQEFPSQFIDLALEYDETLDYLVNRLIALPLDKETSQYRLGFYGGNNLDLVLDRLRTRAEVGDRGMRDKYERTVLLTEAVQLGHELNAQIVTNNIENFMRASGSITPDQLQILQKINAVPAIMRIFEEEHLRMLGRDGLIYRDNYDNTFGLKKDSEGRITGREDGVVIRRFRNYIDKAKDFGMPLSPELANLQDWEIDWAFKVNKILYNMNFRAAEQIGTGHVPEANDPKYRSFPQESAARIMNPIGMTVNRFGIGADRGGDTLGKMTMANYQEQREEDGYGETSIVLMSGGRPLDEFETASMLGISGVFSSWRQSLIILAEVPITSINANGTPMLDSDGKAQLTNVREYIIQSLGPTPTAKSIEATFLKKNGELSENFNSALGIILKLNAITPGGEEEAKDIREAKERVRTAIWKRVARDNPIAMADYINGMQIKGENSIFLTDNGQKDGETKIWQSLADKLTIVHEVRMGRLREGGLDNFDQVLEFVQGFQKDGIKAVELTPVERKLLDRIRSTGEKVAKDLANVRFGYNPFMNDVLFEKMDYSNAGDEFLRRRVGGDFHSFSEAAPALMEIRDDPGFISWDKAIEAERKMVQGLAGPNGIASAQKKLKPFNRAYLSYIEKGGNVQNKVLEWFAKQSIYSWIKEKQRHPTSLAQNISGTGAHSIDEFGYDKIIEHQLHAGIINEEESKRLRKKYRANLGGFILAFFRDVFVITLASGVVEFGKETANAKS